MIDRHEELRLLSLVLDGLDDLYDQRFGPPVGATRDTRAEVWLVRLLISVSVALQDSPWQGTLMNVAVEIQSFIRSGLRDAKLNDAALRATDHLRHELAAATG